MAQANVGRLFIDLEARTARMERDLNKANAKLDQQTKRMKRTAQRNMGAMTSVIQGVVAFGLFRLVKSTVDATDRIAKLGKATGTSTEFLSEMEHAVTLTGGQFEGFAKGMSQLERNVVNANEGMSQQIRAFERVGLRVEDLRNLSPEEIFMRVADAIASIDDPSIKSATAMDIFGRAGKDLVPLLNEGSSGIAKYRKEAQALGLTLSEETAKSAEDLNDNLTRIQESLTVVLRSFIPFAAKIVEGWVLIIGVTREFAAEVARVGRELRLLDQDEEQYRADRIEQIWDEIGARQKLLRELDKEIKATEAVIKRAEDNGRTNEAANHLLEQQTKRRNLARNELKAFGLELDKLTAAQKENEDQTNQGNRPALQGLGDELHEITVTAQHLDPELQGQQLIFASLEITAKALTDRVAELRAEQEALAQRAQQVIDRLDPLAALTREYEGDVAALVDRFSDDEEGLAAAMEKLNREYELNKKRVKESTEEYRKQEEQARATAQAFLQLLGAVGSLNQTFGAGLSPLQSAGVAQLFQNLGVSPGFLNTFAAGAQGGGSLGSQVGGGLGATAGMYFGGPIGAAIGQEIGQIIGDAIGSAIFGSGGPSGGEILFGGANISGRTNPDAGDVRLSAFVEGLIRDGNQAFADEFLGPAVQATEAFFAGLESVLTPEQIAAAAGTLEGRTFPITAENIQGGQFLIPIFDTILSAMEPVIQGFVGQFQDIETRLNAFGAINQTLQLLDADPVQQYADALARANEGTIGTLNRLAGELTDLGQNAFMSVEAMQRMGVGLQQYNQFIIQSLAAIDSARRSVSGTTSSTRDALILQTLDQSGQFEFLTRRAEQLAGNLGRLTDPALIASTVAQINQLTQQAFGIASPEQQQMLLSQFLPFLESVESTAGDRLTQIQDELEQRDAEIRTELRAIFDVGAGAADLNSAAAGNLIDAADRFGAGADVFNKGVGTFGDIMAGAVDSITSEIAG